LIDPDNSQALTPNSLNTAVVSYHIQLFVSSNEDIQEKLNPLPEWLAAYSLLVTGSYNRIRILTDWLLSFVFGQDTTFIKLEK